MIPWQSLIISTVAIVCFVSPILTVTVNAAAVAKHHGVKAFVGMSQMTLAQSVQEFVRKNAATFTASAKGVA
jgi:hypothetical protein